MSEEGIDGEGSRGYHPADNAGDDEGRGGGVGVGGLEGGEERLERGGEGEEVDCADGHLYCHGG